MNYEIVFESDRISFIKVNENLVNDYLKMINDEEVQKYISLERRTYSLEGEEEWVKNKLENNALVFSMIEKDSNSFIGNIEIMSINNNIGEIGISITPSKQNKHFGQEALKRLIEYSFNNLKLDGLELEVFNSNKRAIRCYENVGFIIDGRGKEKNDSHMSIKNNM